MKPELAFRETWETKQRRAKLKSINGMLTRNWVDLYLTEEEFAEMAASRAHETRQK